MAVSDAEAEGEARVGDCGAWSLGAGSKVASVPQSSPPWQQDTKSFDLRAGRKPKLGVELLWALALALVLVIFCDEV